MDTPPKFTPQNPHEPHDRLAKMAREVLAMPVGDDYSHFREMLAWEVNESIPEMSQHDRRGIYGRADALEQATHLSAALSALAKGEKNVDREIAPDGTTIRHAIMGADVPISMFLTAERGMASEAKDMKLGEDIARTREFFGEYGDHDEATHVQSGANDMLDSTSKASGDLLQIQGRMQNLIAALPPKKQIS